jgi:hypothetical protein
LGLGFDFVKFQQAYSLGMEISIQKIGVRAGPSAIINLALIKT